MPEDRANGGIPVIEINIRETLCTEDFLFNTCVMGGVWDMHALIKVCFKMGTLPAGVYVHDILDLINI